MFYQDLHKADFTVVNITLNVLLYCIIQLHYDIERETVHCRVTIQVERNYINSYLV